MRKKITSLLLPFALLAAGLYFVPVKIIGTDFSKVPGDFGDARFNNYILEHGYKFLTGKVDKYWDAPFMYPYKNTIALSDNLLGTVPIYSVFRILGNDRETAFQLWLLTLFALNFICCYRALNKWSNNSVLSATGAYIFAFSIFILGYIMQVQVFPRFIIPLVFYWCWKYLTRKQPKYFLFVLIGIVYQLYCGIYLGFFLVYTILFLFIAYVIVYRDWSLFYQFKKLKILGYHLSAILLACILLAPLMLPYIETSGNLGMRRYEDAFSSIPTLRSYFFTSHAPVLWSFLSEHAKPVLVNWWNHILFMGALPWLGILAIPVILLSRNITLPRKKFIGFLSLGLFLSFLFCLNIDGFSLYKFIFMLPGFSAMCAINRVLNTEIMYFVLIFVFVFDELCKRSRTIKWFVVSFPLLIIVDNLINPQEVSRFEKQESQHQIENIKNKIKSRYDKNYAAIAYLPDNIRGKDKDTHLNVMLASQELNIPCVNGYSGTFPGGYIDFLNQIDESSLNEWRKFNHSGKYEIQTITDFNAREKSRERIYIKAFNDKYVCADKRLNNLIVADRHRAAEWETFLLIRYENNECAIRTLDGFYLSADLNDQGEITASKIEVDKWETFTMHDLEDHFIAFVAANGSYLGVDDKSLQLFARSDSMGANEKFKLMPELR